MRLYYYKRRKTKKQMNMKTKQTTLENTYIPAPLGLCIKWWKSKGHSEATTGTFNYELYLQYLAAISK